MLGELKKRMRPFTQDHSFESDRTLSQAKKAVNLGHKTRAIALYQLILYQHPGHLVAKKALRNLQKGLPKGLQKVNLDAAPNDPTKEQLKVIVGLCQARQLSLAEKTCRKQLKQYPNSLVLIDILGAILLRRAKYPDAIDIFNRAIQIRPGSADSYYYRGNAQHALKQMADAEKSYQQAILCNPEHIEAHSNLGVVLLEQGQAEKALECCRRAIEMNPAFSAAYYNCANALASVNRPEEAISNYQIATQLKPDYAEAYNNCGSVQLKMGLLELGMQSFDVAIKIKADYAEAHNNRGNALASLERWREAVLSYDRAIELNPIIAKAFFNRGTALLVLGEASGAIQNFNQAILLEPEYVEVYTSLGVLQRDLGLVDAALESFKQAVFIKPDYAEGHYNLGMLKQYRSGDEQIDQMESLLGGTATCANGKMFVNFALARAYGHIGDISCSFNRLKKANSYRKAQLSYDVEQDRYLTDTIKEVFSNTHVAELELSDSPVQAIFIIGMPRSGTSLVEQILASHSQVFAAGELTSMNKILVPMLMGQTSKVTSGLSIQDIYTLRDRYLKMLPDCKKLNVVTDKMPLNYKAIGLIHMALPSAKIVYCQRPHMDLLLGA